MEAVSPRLGYKSKDGYKYKDLSEPQESPAATWSGGIFSMFVVFGIASLTPWHMFITATAYFESKFQGSGPTIEQNYQNYFQTGAICTDVLFSFLTVPLARLVKLPRLVYFALSLMLAMFLLTTCLARVDSSLWAREFFIVSEMSFCVMCGGGSMYISSMYALTSTLHPIYIDAFSFGLTCAGILASVLNIVTLSIPNLDFVDAGFWYFAAASCILLLTLTLFSIFQCHFYEENTPSISDADSADSSNVKKSSVWSLVKATAGQGYSEFFGLYITFMMFPAVLSTLQTTVTGTSSWTTRYFLPVTLFLCFNLGDLVGKIVSRISDFPGPRWMPWYSTARVGFVVLLLMCNLQPRSIPVWFTQHDAVPAVVIFLFAATLGHIFTLGLRFAAEIGQSGPDKATIGTIMGLHLALGRVLGSFSTYLVFLLIR